MPIAILVQGAWITSAQARAWMWQSKLGVSARGDHGTAPEAEALRDGRPMAPTPRTWEEAFGYQAASSSDDRTGTGLTAQRDTRSSRWFVRPIAWMEGPHTIAVPVEVRGLPSATNHHQVRVVIPNSQPATQHTFSHRGYIYDIVEYHPGRLWAVPITKRRRQH